MQIEVQAQCLDKTLCCPCSVWIHEEGMDTRVAHSVIACVLLGFAPLYTLFCWDAPVYNKRFIHST